MLASNTITHEDLVVKNIDYFSEEYVKQLCLSVLPGKKLRSLFPYIGVVRYPSETFLTGSFAFQKTVQFQSTLLIGYMDALLPERKIDINTKFAFTLLQFTLDGVNRQFLQITQPDYKDANGLRFEDYIQSLYPDANNQIPFNRSAIHTLTDFQITGSEYKLDDNEMFIPVSTGTGAYTPNIEFEFSVSGYSAVIE